MRDLCLKLLNAGSSLCNDRGEGKKMQVFEDKLAEKVKNVGEWWQTNSALKSSQQLILAFGLLSQVKFYLPFPS